MARSADSSTPDRSSAYTIPILCAGIAIIACCLLIPAADENHRLVYEREKLRQDLEQIQKQVTVYDQFLHGVPSDPSLLERLAQRQMRLVPKGTNVVPLRHEEGPAELSPFLLVNLPPPAELPPYRPVGGVFAALCRQPRSQLFLLGAGMFLVAAGIVMGAGAKPGAAD